MLSKKVIKPTYLNNLIRLTLSTKSEELNVTQSTSFFMFEDVVITYNLLKNKGVTSAYNQEGILELIFAPIDLSCYDNHEKDKKLESLLFHFSKEELDSCISPKSLFHSVEALHELLKEHNSLCLEDRFRYILSTLKKKGRKKVLRNLKILLNK